MPEPISTPGLQASDRPGLLSALCDTLVPALPPGDAGPDAARLLATSAPDLGIDLILGEVMSTWAPHVRALVEQTLGELGSDFADLPVQARVARWREVQRSPRGRAGALILQSTVLAMFYTAPDERLSNPTWPGIGYPGPLAEPPSEAEFPKTLRLATVPAGDETATMTADVVVVGSGAGGAVTAARLAALGHDVLVLERGSYRNEPDLPQLEAVSFPNLYLGGGFLWSTDASVGLLAGSTVGGGTTVNSMACLPTPDYVLQEWSERGVEGADESFGQHVESVMDRINAKVTNTVHNRVNEILNRGLDALGRRHATLARNARDDQSRYCGECNAGCLLGCKQSTMKTFLQDASDHGARLLPDAVVQEVLHEDGRAVGVVAQVRDPQDPSRSRTVRVESPVVVLAAGALATPTLLLSSGIGGPAVGKNLHVHPSYFMSGVFDEVVEGWAGQILTSVCHDFDRIEGDHGFVIEAAPMGLGFWTALTPWSDPERHKQEQLRLRHVSGVWAFARDHGAGEVLVGEDGLPLVRWGLDDPVDLAVVRRAHVEVARILRAAGAREIFTFLPGDPRWHEGEDFEAFTETLARLEAEEIFTLSAHQSGTCASGSDPGTSVVDGRGELHDVRGVFVTDASALPTAPGVNPMVSIEAFASKTAAHVDEAIRAAAAVS